jgi:hypothetical protein
VIDYNGRKFRPVTADDDAPVAEYHQEGNLVWTEFAGGNVRRGSLTGICAPDGTIELTYTMVLTGGEVIAGHSVNTPQFLADGRLRIHEQWERYGPNAATGVSYLEEV